MIRAFAIAAATLAIASSAFAEDPFATASAAAPCVSNQRQYAGRTYRITCPWYFQPAWCDACGVRYEFNPASGNWVVRRVPSSGTPAKQLKPVSN